MNDRASTSGESEAMEVPSETAPPPRERRRKRAARHAGFGFGVVFRLAVAGLILGYIAMAVSGQPFPLSDDTRAALERRISALIGEGEFALGGTEVIIGRDFVPRISFTNVSLGDAAGGGVAQLNALRMRISPAALLRGEIAASRINLSGAQITLRRNADGSFAMQAGAPVGEGVGFGALLGGVDQALQSRALAEIERVSARGVVLTLEDARSGRIWQASNALLTLNRTDDGLSISLTSDVFNGTDDLAEVQVSLRYTHASRTTTIGATLSNAAADDIAVQAPALAWLQVLDAPISGAVRAVLDGDGALEALAGTLDLGEGALRPTDATEPLTFDSARAYFSFDPGKQRIDFSELAVASELGSLSASGHTYLSDVRDGWPAAYLGQFIVSEARLVDGGLFEGPVALEDLRADMRLRLDPFTVEVPQIAVAGPDGAEGAPIRARALVSAEQDGWHLSVESHTDRILPETITSHWPVRAAPRTRDWLKRNVIDGVLRDVALGVRAAQGEKPKLSLSFDFEDGVVRFMKNMPHAKEGRGRATLANDRFALVVENGFVTAANGDVIDGAGTVFSVSDVEEKPAPGSVAVRVEGSVPGVIALLNNPPFRVMERAGRSDLIGTGRAQVSAQVSLPLKDGIRDGDVTYAASAVLRDFRSESLVENRVLTSSALQLATTPEGIRVHGPARLDGVPLTADWRQAFGPGAREAGSVVTGDVALSPETLAAFAIPLPSGLLSGSGRGDYTLSLKPGERPELVLSTDLDGLGLSLPSLGWSKDTGATGQFDLTARLGDIPEVTAMALTAPGLSLQGNINLGEGGRFLGATLAPLRVGNWLDANVRLTPGGGIALTGGSFDLRQFSRIERQASSGGGPIEVRLDRMAVTDAITFAPITGRFQPLGSGLDGSFEARVNGETPITGTLVPSNGGTAVRLRTSNAGGVIGDAGLSPNARGGTLDIVMTPVRDAPGTYDGEFLIEGIRVQKAPAMADLLDAISVVGLVDQLNGNGIGFDTVDGRFRLTPNALQLRQAAAVGGSLGVSLDGFYDLNAKVLNMQGVISPVYFLNGIGSLLTRRGEGLFGFNFRLAGTAANPDVSVNPLSILTPGMFRSIFRRDAPTQ